MEDPPAGLRSTGHRGIARSASDPTSACSPIVAEEAALLDSSYSDALLQVLRRSIVAGVRADEPDLTLRQLATLLQIYVVEKPQTVRAVAAYLAVQPQAVTQAYLRLEELGYLRHGRKSGDRRSVVAVRTVAGAAAVAAIRARLTENSMAELRSVRTCRSSQRLATQASGTPQSRRC